jgi:hypothetical protein
MPAFVLGAIALFTGLIAVFAAAVLYLASRAFRVAHRHVSRRSRDRFYRQRAKTDREVADALAPFGADISIWPSRAPQNGSTHTPDPVE